MINMIELKKKRASIALGLVGHLTTPRAKKSWRKSFGGVSGGFFGTSQNSDLHLTYTGGHMGYGSDGGISPSSTTSPTAENGGGSSSHHNGHGGSARRDRSKRHSTALGRLPSLKGFKTKFGLKKNRGSPVDQLKAAEED